MGWVLGAALVALLVWLVEASHVAVGDESLQRVTRRGVLRVGYSVGLPFVRVDGGIEPHGPAVDAIPGIARSLGVRRIEWVQTAYSQLIPDLLDRRFDMVASQLVTSPERGMQVGFSAPAIRVRYAVLVACGNPRQVPTWPQLRPQAGQVVAVIRQSVAETQLRRRGFTDAQLLLVSEGESGEATLRVGAAQALVRTEASLQVIVDKHPQEFELLPDGRPAAESDLSMAYAFHPADGALLKAWNVALARQPSAGPAP